MHPADFTLRGRKLNGKYATRTQERRDISRNPASLRDYRNVHVRLDGTKGP